MFIEKIAPNGAKFIFIPMRGTNTAAILVMFGTGSRYEEKNISGLSHFLEHMFFKGTKKRANAQKLSGELDGLGCDYNAFTSKEFTGYWIKSENKKIDKAAEILSDMLFNSKFDQAEIDRERGVIIEEINMYEDDPAKRVEDVLEDCLYGDTPAGRSVAGTKETVAKLNRDDFIKYYSSQYTGDNMIICMAGNISNKKGEEILNKYFTKKNKNKIIAKKAIIETQKEPKISLYYKKTDQAHISVAFRGLAANHPLKPALHLLSVILGGAMSSRMFVNLRERNGLAYYVRTFNEFYTDSGYMTTQAGVPVDKIEKSIKIILEEYKKIRDEKISLKELNKFKDLISGRTAIKFESSDDVAEWYGWQAVMQIGENKKLISSEKYLKTILALTPKDLSLAARYVIDASKLNLAIIGPYKDKSIFTKTIKDFS